MIHVPIIIFRRPHCWGCELIEILQELENFFGIKSNYLSKEEWDFTKSTKQWKLCISQILKEQIAIEIVKNLKIQIKEKNLHNL